ncbi:MAG: hypothetical protein CVU57_13845 [Deltaproteobacteria bacterium HGW-Deltaproteobacteria-15]|jgi:thiol-disulfide isomerase/thioredoxin|nr:MAG: hypothetical protein CVU57_13845 [Deltaproteobacteria bacterium HGW-Deltaproteobacteria-15]
MTKAICAVLFVLALLLYAQPIPAAEIRIAGEKKIQLKSPPVDLAVSMNGNWIYALTREGDILVYSGDGKLAGRVEIGETGGRIRVGPSEDVILLTSPEKNFVRVVTLDFVKDIRSEGSPFKGSRDAPVVITEFSGFQCPHCAALAPVLRQIHERYPNRVKIVFKNFLLKNHRFGAMAAAAALAADHQGAFWPFHDRLFENGNELNDEKIRKISLDLGLNQEKFVRDMRHPDTMRQIGRDFEDAQKAGVKGVPSVFVNGRIVKDRSLEGITSMIEEEFKRSSIIEEKCLECTEPTNQ